MGWVGLVRYVVHYYVISGFTLAGNRTESLLHRLVVAVSSFNTRLLLVVANGAYYHVSFRRPLRDVLTAIRLGRTVALLEWNSFPNGERVLRSTFASQALYAAVPDAVSLFGVADRCHFCLDELKFKYPEEPLAAGWDTAGRPASTA